MTTGLLTTNAGGDVVLRRVRVRVLDGPSRDEEVLLDGGTIIVGSHVDADLQVQERTVSRFHAELGLLADGVRLRDLSSTNGTFVGGHRIESLVVQPGCEFRVGKVRLALSPADLPAPDAAPDITEFGALVGESAVMRRAFGLLQTAAQSDVPVLLEGEPGTGKSTAARALHQASHRSGGPLVVFDVLAPARPLAEAAGMARGGTLLLENVDCASRSLANEIEVLANRAESQRREGLRADIRLIASSRTDLRDAVQAGRFSRGLYFLIAGIRVLLPPLRDRRDDIGLILRALARRFELVAIAEGPEMDALRADPLQGNVRELTQLLQRTASRLRAQAASSASVPPPVPSGASNPGPRPTPDDMLADLPFKEAKEQLVDAFERRYVEALLERHDGNVSRAAADAGLDRNYLSRLAKKHGLR